MIVFRTRWNPAPVATISLQPRIDQLAIRAQRRRRPPLRTLPCRRDRRPKRLAHGAAMHHVPARQLPDREPLPITIPADLLKQLHSRHPFCDLRPVL